jgi:2'-5' RNA ligase
MGHLILSHMADLKKKYDKPLFSYVYWPVRIPGVDKPDLHITCKFLGEVELETEDLAPLVKAGIKYPLIYKWEAVEFDSKNDGKVKVLEIVKFDPAMTLAHDSLGHLKKDDYPSYRPHITVPESYWLKVKNENIDIMDVGLQVKLLTAKIKGKTHKLF